MERTAVLISRSGRVNVKVKQLDGNGKWVVIDILDKGVTAYSNIFWKTAGGYDRALVANYIDRETGKTLVLAPPELEERELHFV